MLKPENTEKLIFLKYKYNLRMVGFKYQMLCEQFFHYFDVTANFILICSITYKYDTGYIVNRQF